MTELLNDELFNKIMSSEEEDYIFDTFFPLIPKMSKYIKENTDSLLILARRFIAIINKILTMFLTSEDIKVLPDEKKNEILNVKSCSELVVNKLSKENANLNDKELLDSMNIIFKFFNKLNEDQKLLGKSLDNVNNTLDKGTKDLLETVTLKKISDYCKDNFEKSNAELDFKQIDIYYNQIINMIKGFDKDIINDTLTNFEEPENCIENVNKIKAYNMVQILKILLHLKNKKNLSEDS
jgi:hypothetical protein